MGLVSHWVILSEPERAGAGGAALMVKITGVLKILEQVPLEY
jgi:hypothetical protein